MLQKLCCRTRTQMSLPSFSGIHVHLAPSDDSCDTIGYTLDAYGRALGQDEVRRFLWQWPHGG